MNKNQIWMLAASHYRPVTNESPTGCVSVILFLFQDVNFGYHNMFTKHRQSHVPKLPLLNEVHASAEG